MSRGSRLALVAAVAAALLTFPASYALLRGYDALFGSEPNPATIFVSTRIAMFWRLGIGAYVAGMVAFAVFFAARSRLAATMRALHLAALVVAAAITAQGLLLP